MVKAFISYSWEDEEHKEWVRSFADRLLENGIEAMLDRYDLSPGERLPYYMEQSVSNADYVLIICTPTYKEKAEGRKGGVGYEEHIITGELFAKGNEKKYIPVIRKGNTSNALPVSLAGKFAVDLKDGPNYETNFNELVMTLKGISKKPPVKKSARIEKTLPKTLARNDEPIHILGIETEKVTMPKMDGSLGSALYKIPFKLSKRPSAVWIKLFVQAWNEPLAFSTLHRPGIASVYGDEIILDGTTLEEVKNVHKETLLICVDEANKQEKEYLEAEQKKKEREDELRNKHFNNVYEIAESITF